MADEETNEAKSEGFARTPDVLRFGGPQMEDYADWDSWCFARQQWVFERMLERWREGMGEVVNL